MADLTANEITEINALTGNDLCTPAAVDNTLMEYFFDSVFPDAADRSQAILRTVVKVLQVMVAKAKIAAMNLTTGGTRSSDMDVRRLERLRDYYARQAGMGGGAISVGVLDLGLADDDLSEWDDL